jgi:AcrR family transcriptional regulator
MTVRPYRQTRRAEAAAATRRGVVYAGRAQLLSGDRFTIEAVARRAGVSRVTVYNLFGDRDRLREAIYDDLATTGGLDRIPEAFAAASPADGIARLVEIFCGFYAAHRTILRRLNALAALAAGSGQRPLGRNRRRRHILSLLVGRAAARPEHEGLDVEAATGRLLALTSFEFYDQLAACDPGTPPASVIRPLALALLARKP